MSSKERVASFKTRQKAKGLIRVEFWIKPEWKEKIVEFINLLERKK